MPNVWTHYEVATHLHLFQLNQAGITIMLVSDASVLKDKQSSFAWVIAKDKCTLWKGVGLAPGSADNIYSQFWHYEN